MSTTTATPLSPDDQITLGVTSDIGAVAGALAAVFKMGDDIFNVLNSPAMLEARKSAAVQAELLKLDADLATAQKTGDLTEINKEASG
jgi:hypothetical protein